MVQVQSEKIKDKISNKNSKLEVKYRAFYLSLNVIKYLDTIPYKSSTKIIQDQLIRSVTSIGANIVEAKASASKREFINYFHIALKSANEVKYWLALLRELLADRLLIDGFISEVNEISKILGSSLLTMKGKRSL